MSTQEALSNRIKQLCEEKGITINHLCYLAGMPRSTIYNIVDAKNANPQIMNLKRICDAFEITLREFFDAEEFQNLEPELD